MRIGIDATALPPRPVGAGNYIIHLIRSLAEVCQGDELVIFAHRSRLPLLNLAPSSGVTIVPLPDRSRPLRLAWEQVGLPYLARKHRLDVLHSLHYTMPAASPCPVVVTFHDMTFFLFPRLHTPSKRFFFRAAIRHSAAHASALLSISESTRQDTIHLMALDPGRIVTSPLGVDPAFRVISDRARLEAVRQKYGLPGRFLLYVGLVEPRKNLPSLIRAFASSRQQFPDCRLVIAGRLGWMYEEVFRLVKDLGLEGTVCFPGYVESEDLPEVYNLAEVFVYPTFYEGFGLPVLEAMACGVPVITSSVSSLPEITGEAGLLVPPGSVDALSEAIAGLLSDEERRRDLSQRGVERAAPYTWERTARITREVYQRFAG